METASTTNHAPARTSPDGEHTRAPDSLDALAALDAASLERIYREASVPDSLAALDGHPRGRMLAVRSLDRAEPGAIVRYIASAPWFPWGGKSFTAEGDTGRGTNRVHLLGRHQLFPFRTRMQPSVLDGKPCVALDYDLADNPWLIRKIHDEVRDVGGGLYLGPAMWKGAQGPSLVLWFALDTRIQARPVGG